jgi:hypothetical protein
MKIRNIASIIFLTGISSTVFAQQPITRGELLGRNNVLTTTVPFLIITPDSRSGAMGDVGVAISPDANTIHWNPAKLAFMENDLGVSLTYTPWLRNIVRDINLSYLSAYKKLNDRSGAGIALRYFSLGDITFTDDAGTTIKTYRPNEFSIDAAYALKLSDNFSMGLAGRFINSDLAGQLTMGTTESKPGRTFAADISGYYTKEIKVKDKKSTLSFGGNISNIGGKITYTEASDRDFIPINLRLGSYLNIPMDEHNKIAFAIDFNKLLVPSDPIYWKSSNGIDDSTVNGKRVVRYGKDPDRPVITGMLSSFTDAPGGFKEEIREINPSIGIEYWYKDMFAGRAGYFYEHPSKGNRQYLTVGVGVRYNLLGIDLAYLIPTSSTINGRNPLENTLRFTLMFNVSPKGQPKK